jgi:general L-amino acid transport system permease protein
MAFWNDRRTRGVLYQVAALGGVLLVGGILVSNTMDNLARQNIATGFGFLTREAGFGISEHLVDYSPADTYLRALWIGLLNTLRVAFAGIALATILGIVVGFARLSSNWLVARLASVYVEVTRNVPVLLHMFFWYAMVTQAFPSPADALQPITGFFLSNRGVAIPWPGLGVPHLDGFNFRGGAVLSPELSALLIALSVYTSGFIAETVRGGILSVPKGQLEAARSMGLTGWQVLRFVTMPLALRAIVPGTTNQYLNLAKNSALAVAIGYPDFVSVANTAINQTGQAVEGVAMIMAAYLTLSLLISAFMNWYNKHVALIGERT